MFFQAQAALVAVLATAFVVPFVDEPRIAWLRGPAVAIAVIGVCGETFADAQLARWRRDPT